MNYVELHKLLERLLSVALTSLIMMKTATLSLPGDVRVSPYTLEPPAIHIPKLGCKRRSRLDYHAQTCPIH